MHRDFLPSTLLAIMLLIFTACDKEEQHTPAKPETLPKVKVHTLKKSAYPLWIRFTGKTEAICKQINI